ncbi:MAG TPA: CocE/NonD family hydrolase [Paucimonas sp.]|nr:CocE/NonD family hydrolase [Paucimonas sp.]
MALRITVTGLSLFAGTGFAKPLVVSTKLHEQVVMIPAVSGAESVQLETTIFKPPGDGPFPLLVMNHGKALGDPHAQERDRFIVISREFVKHGYAVAIPMRKGFAQSTGTYVEKACDMSANGQIQADDLQNTLNYLTAQSWVDKNHILIAGQSYGGLATMAFGTRGFPGVKGLINFAGGLRIHGGNCPWRTSLIDAFAEFGRHTMVPSLWFYGENDRHFNPELASKMHDAYVRAGGNAKLVAYGPFKNDAHGMSSSWDGVKIWWPDTEKFLKEIGMPVDEMVALVDDSQVQKTDFAALDNVDAVPYLQDKGRAAYRDFLGKSLPRAFAISASGAWSWAEDGDDPVAKVLANCQKGSSQPCRLYAVNDYVVWSDAALTAAVPKEGEGAGK